MEGEYLKLETVKTMAELLKENEELRETIEETKKYIDKMSFGDIVDNPKKDLVKILKRSDKE
jgi:hypothetical protein